MKTNVLKSQAYALGIQPLVPRPQCPQHESPHPRKNIAQPSWVSVVYIYIYKRNPPLEPLDVKTNYNQPFDVKTNRRHDILRTCKGGKLCTCQDCRSKDARSTAPQAVELLLLVPS